jgi:hypothetical protein
MQFVNGLGDDRDLVTTIAEGLAEILHNTLHPADSGPVLARYKDDTHGLEP